MDTDDPEALAKTVTQDVARPDALDSLDLGGERYERVALLGRGGMGEVRLCADKRIGREIALKMILQAWQLRATLPSEARAPLGGRRR